MTPKLPFLWRTGRFTNQKISELFGLSYSSVSRRVGIFSVTPKLVVDRADENQSNMSLTSWKGAIVRKQDIYITKNYLTEDEIDSLNRFVVVFLEIAELRAKNRQDITIKFWQENINRIIELNDKALLTHKGSISKVQMEKQVNDVYEKFNAKRKITEAQLADKQDFEELKQLEEKIKKH